MLHLAARAARLWIRIGSSSRPLRSSLRRDRLPMAIIAAVVVALSALPRESFAASIATPLPVAASAAEAGMSAAQFDRLHRYMREATGKTGYAGGVTLVARDGRIVDWQAYGYRDLARAQPMRRDAIFRIYSMTKTITSVAVLQLVEDGRITLDDPIARYLPELASPMVATGGSVDAPTLRASSRPITIRHLLTHTAGFPAGLPGDDIAVQLQECAAPHGAADLRGFVQRLAQAPLAADPGTRFGYDGAATETLARMVEVVSGQSFESFLQQRILDPLRMVDTGFRVPVDTRDRIADITRMGADGRLALDDGPSARTPGAPLNVYASGAGGLYSTAGDYARFAQMLLDGGTLDGARILGRKTVTLMLLNHLTMLDKPVTQFSDAEGFGLGGSVLLDVAKRGVPGSEGQFGWAGAASTSYTIDPSERLVAILMLQHLPNDRPDDLPRISRNFYGLVYPALTR